MGSFVVTWALRFARGEQAWAGRSHCDGCGRSLSFVQTVPIASYLRAGGACGGCGSRIDPLHLVGELAGGLIAVAAVALSDFSRGLLFGILGFTLLAASAVDAKTQRLPNPLTFVSAATCAVLALMRSAQDLVAGVLIALAAVLILQGVRAAFRARRGDAGLGLGDVKLIASLSIWLGLAAPWMVVVAATSGLFAMSVLRPADRRMAFGPCIAFGGVAVGLMREMNPWPI